jgi:hypothetical protein
MFLIPVSALTMVGGTARLLAATPQGATQLYRSGGPMKLQPPDDQPFPVQRAFVVQVHATAAVAQGPLTGRVEHVLSGQAVHFQTVDDLLAFIARVLTRIETAPEEPP